MVPCIFAKRIILLASWISSTSASFASSSTASMAQPPPAKVAIIGAGAAGLAAARIFQRSKERNHYHITVLEADDTIGGVWKYRATTTTTATNDNDGHDNSSIDKQTNMKKNRPMYRSLRTNLPMEIMAFREMPWTRRTTTKQPPAAPPHQEEEGGHEEETEEEETSFLSHTKVQEYLEEYARIFGLHQYIHFGAKVRQLQRVANTTNSSRRSAVSPAHEDWPQLRLQWQQQGQQPESNSFCDEVFDAVVICNGHYNIPRVPSIPGFDEGYFVGTSILHSIEYDIPAPFRNQTVLCIGGRASGSDIAREIAALGGPTRVYLSDPSVIVETVDHNVTMLPRTVRLLPDGRFVFEHMDEPIAGIDTVIFCTGYDYDFSFLNNEQSDIELDSSRRRVMPLYQQLWHARYPNLAFIGLPHSVVPFPLFEVQAAAVERSWRRPGASADDAPVLPDLANRMDAAMRDANAGGGVDGAGRVPDDTHYLGSAQWDYCRHLAGMAGLRDESFEAYIATNQVRFF
jgi:cation diffusion facilitator CzcD-associated flavoprotein CzcO